MYEASIRFITNCQLSLPVHCTHGHISQSLINKAYSVILYFSVFYTIRLKYHQIKEEYLVFWMI